MNTGVRMLRCRKRLHLLTKTEFNLVTLNHDLSVGGNRKATYCKPIVIEDNVWIGINATILPGVTLGRNCVVAAGSVVTKDVPADTIVAGNSAKIVKRIK